MSITLVLTLLLAAHAPGPLTKVLPPDASVATDSSGKVAILNGGKVEIRNSFDGLAISTFAIPSWQEPRVMSYRGRSLVITHGTGEAREVAVVRDDGTVVRRWQSPSLFSHRAMSFDGSSLATTSVVDGELRTRFEVSPNLPEFGVAVLVESLDGLTRSSLNLAPTGEGGRPPAQPQSVIALASDDIIVAFEWGIMRYRQNHTMWFTDRLDWANWKLTDASTTDNLVVAVAGSTGHVIALRLDDGKVRGHWKPEKGLAKARAIFSASHGESKVEEWKRRLVADFDANGVGRRNLTPEQAADVDLFGASTARILPNGKVAILGGRAAHQGIPEWLAVFDPGRSDFEGGDILGRIAKLAGDQARHLYFEDVVPQKDGTILIRADDGWYQSSKQ